MKEKDTSKQTGFTMMIVCGIIGLLLDGLSGAFWGAWIGFAMTAVVLAAQESFK